MNTAWILLKFNADYTDEFDCESIVITTKARWERAKEVLRKAYPNDSSFTAGFGTNESIEFTAQEYIDSFTEHEISLACAKDMARAIGRARAKYEGWNAERKSFAKLSWIFLIESGVLPNVPDVDGALEDWIYMLAFDTSPQKCHAHGNIIGRCSQGAMNIYNMWDGCRADPEIELVHIPDADYESLVRS